MKISIVTTMYCSAQYIEEFYSRISASVSKITKNYEMIFVNDGSPDRSLEIAVNLFKNDKKVKVLDLSRNFGHHKAIMAGLAHTTGNYVFLIDCDLEEEPEWIEFFWEELNKDDSTDVIYGVQEKRKGNIWNRSTGFIFYKFYNMLSDVKIQKDVVTVRLMKKNYVKALLSYQERELFLAGIFADAGFNQKSVTVIKGHNSPTTYSLKRRINLMINSITSFSNKPLRIIFYTGLIVCFISVIFTIRVFFKKLFGNVELSGWTSLILSIWLLGGIIIFSIGVIGIYLSKVFNEIKLRPNSIVKKIYEKKKLNE